MRAPKRCWNQISEIPTAISEVFVSQKILDLSQHREIPPGRQNPQAKEALSFLGLLSSTSMSPLSPAHSGLIPAFHEPYLRQTSVFPNPIPSGT